MSVKGRYHLAGVAGVGMSALAQVLMAEGYDVSGSDRHLDRGTDMDVLRKLRKGGARLFPQDGSGLAPDVRGLVVSTAIEKDNPEIRAADRLRIPVLHRAEALARLMEGKQSIAVTGTSGKSTVTGMIGWILEQVGADPVVVNGGAVLNWVTGKKIGNVRLRTGARKSAGSEWWVFEADESDRSLLKFDPTWAVITNVSKDHFDVAETSALFEQFRARVRVGVIDQSELAGILKGFDPEVGADGSVFRYKKARIRLRIPGRHNAENAAFAAAMCERLGFAVEEIGEALSSFKGIQRRLEVVGKERGITVIDDYAHNPAKIRAAWEALAPYHRRVAAIWRPHGYAPLRSMMEDLVGLFGEVCRKDDRLYVLPVYDAGGTADRSVNSDKLVERLREHGVPAIFWGGEGGIVQSVVAGVESGDAILTMGARDPALPVLARKILERLRVADGRWAVEERRNNQ